jgi:integrase/recombinase XerD
MERCNKQGISTLPFKYNSITRITQKEEYPPFFTSTIESFKIWLTTLGYSINTITNLPIHAQEFLHWLEKQGYRELTGIKEQTVNHYFELLSQRKNKRTKGTGLSLSYLNKHREALIKLSTYLQQSKGIYLPVNIKSVKSDSRKITILSSQEISKLYKTANSDLLGLRDKAILSIYYGCGLRRSEGVQLNVSDIDFNKKLLYVQKSKNGYGRKVPMSEGVMRHLESYVYGARDCFLDPDKATDALFLSRTGKRTISENIVYRLFLLKEKSGIRTQFSLPSLRHSIATHLLQRGISLENIALFLGHKSLDSTQIYTHIAHAVGKSLGISH